MLESSDVLMALPEATRPTPRDVARGLTVDPDATASDCPHCCHWALPLLLLDPTRKGDTLTYQEWLAYHWHVRTHQGLAA